MTIRYRPDCGHPYLEHDPRITSRRPRASTSRWMDEWWAISRCRLCGLTPPFRTEALSNARIMLRDGPLSDVEWFREQNAPFSDNAWVFDIGDDDDDERWPRIPEYNLDGALRGDTWSAQHRTEIYFVLALNQGDEPTWCDNGCMPNLDGARWVDLPGHARLYVRDETLTPQEVTQLALFAAQEPATENMYFLEFGKVPPRPRPRPQEQ